MKFFQNITTNYNIDTENHGKMNAVIMGRKTWESLSKILVKNLGRRPLKNRVNIVLSRAAGPELEEELDIDEENNTAMFDSLENALEFCEDNEDMINEVFVIGGSMIYNEADKMKGRVKNVFETRVGQKIEGDVKLKKGIFSGMERIEMSKSYSEDGLNFDFSRYANPGLFGEFYDEYNTSVLKSRCQEYEYIDLVKDIIENGKRKFLPKSKEIQILTRI